MEMVLEIDNLLDAIDREIGLLSQVTREMSLDLDTLGTQDLAHWLGSWEPFDLFEEA